MLAFTYLNCLNKDVITTIFLDGTNLGLTPANRAGSYGAGLVEPSQDLGHAAVRDEQLPADVARPHPQDGQLHDPFAHHVWQRPAVHEHAPQLVDACLT